MNKRYTAIILLAVLLAMSFTACGKSPVEAPPELTKYTTLPHTTVIDITFITTTMPESTSETTTENTTAAEPTGESTTERVTFMTAPHTTAEPTTVRPTVPLTLFPETTAKPTTEAPATAPPPAVIACDIIAENIAGNTDYFDDDLVQSSSSRACALFGLTADDFADLSYYGSSSATADELLVIRYTQGSEQKILDGINVHIEDQVDYFAINVPSQMEKIDRATVYQNGTYIIFCISNNSNGIDGKINEIF